MSPEIYAQNLFFRKDISSKLSSFACSEKNSFSWKDYLYQGIYDANVVLQKLEIRPGITIQGKDVESAARQLASTHGHLGFSYGSCANETQHWIASMPAPSPVYVDQKALIQVPSELLFQFCSQSKIEFAQAGIATSRMLFNLDSKKSYEQFQINSQFLKDGVLSLSCVSRNNSNQGPVLWSIFPIKNGPLPKVPYVEVFDKISSVGELQTWVDWLNLIRKDLKAPALKLAMDKAVTDPLAELLKNGSTYHDRKLNSQTRQELRKYKLNMIGETRVISRDIEEAAWLLWNSPSHRSLLISQKVNRVSILKKTFSEDFLTVLVFSSAETNKLSRKAKKP